LQKTTAENFRGLLFLLHPVEVTNLGPSINMQNENLAKHFLRNILSSWTHGRKTERGYT